jgi:hypothetical protein
MCFTGTREGERERDRGKNNNKKQNCKARRHLLSGELHRVMQVIDLVR